MPIKTGAFTPRERKLVEVYAVTGDQRYSAQKAGFAGQSGAAMALQRPAIQEEIRRVQMERLFQDVLPLAVRQHLALLEDPKTPAGAKVQAIKLAYDRTLGSQEGAESKAPHEMTADEIQRELTASKLRLAALESAKADMAKPVIEAKVDELFE